MPIQIGKIGAIKQIQICRCVESNLLITSDTKFQFLKTESRA